MQRMASVNSADHRSAVATTSIPVPQTSGIMTSPVHFGATTVVFARRLVTSAILPFGMAVRVLTGKGRRDPATFTSPVTIRTGFVASARPYSSPLGHTCPFTVTEPSITSTSSAHPLGQLMQIKRILRSTPSCNLRITRHPVDEIINLNNIAAGENAGH